MLEISFSSSFKRAYKKRIKGNLDLEARFWQKVEQFALDQLSGKLKDLWSFSVEYDERVLFYFSDDGKAVFVDIGNHDEVY